MSIATDHQLAYAVHDHLTTCPAFADSITSIVRSLSTNTKASPALGTHLRDRIAKLKKANALTLFKTAKNPGEKPNRKGGYRAKGQRLTILTPDAGVRIVATYKADGTRTPSRSKVPIKSMAQPRQRGRPSDIITFDSVGAQSWRERNPPVLWQEWECSPFSVSAEEGQQTKSPL